MAAGRNTRMLEAGRAASAGLFMIIAMLLGTGAGFAADNHFGTTPWGVMVGFAFGMAAGFRELFQIARTIRLNKPGDDGRAP